MGLVPPLRHSGSTGLSRVSNSRAPGSWDFTADHAILGQEQDGPLEAWENLDAEAQEGGP